MKRIISILLCTAMMISLIACGNSGSAEKGSEETVTLTMWAHQETSWNMAYEEAIAAFEAENHGINIELETFPYDDFESKVQTSLIDGEGGADIYELWGGWGLDFAPTGALMEFPEEFANEVFEGTFAPTYGALTHEGKLYGMPFEFNIENGGMLVNNTIMEANGLTVPTTWEELKETAIKGTVHDGNVFQVKGFDFVNWDSVPYYFLSLILQQGANYMTEDGAFDVTTEEAKVAFDELASMVTVDKVTDLEGLTGGADLEGYQQLYAGRNMMVPRGPWAIGEGIVSFELEFGKDFDYVEVPWYGSEHKFAAETGWSLAVNAKCAEQEAAMKFVEYMWQDEVMLNTNISCSQIPAKKSLAESAEYLEAMPHAEPLLGILEGAQFIGYFNTDRLKEAINDVFVEYCSGNYASIDDAMNDLNGKLNDTLK